MKCAVAIIWYLLSVKLLKCVKTLLWNDRLVRIRRCAGTNERGRFGGLAFTSPSFVSLLLTPFDIVLRTEANS